MLSKVRYQLMKSKKLLYRLLVLFIAHLWTLTLYAQSDEMQVAEVQRLIEKASEALANNDAEQTIIYGIDAVNRSTFTNYELTSKAMLVLAKGYYTKKDYNNALDFSVQALTVLKQSPKSTDQTEAHSLLGDIYLAWEIPTRAIDHLEELYQLQQANRGASYPFHTVERLAKAYLQVNNRQRAVVLFKWLLAEAAQQEKTAIEARALEQLSLLYVAKKEYPVALEYAEKYVSALAKQKVPVQQQATAMQNVGYIYRQLKEHDNSVEWMLKAVSLNRSPQILNNLGVSYIHRKSYEQATLVLEESLGGFQHQQDIAGEVKSYTYLAANEHVQGLHQEALEFVSKAVDIARTNDLSQELADAYLLQSEIYTAMGDFRRSQEAYKLQSEIVKQLEQQKQAQKENTQQRAIIAQEQESQSQMMVSEKEKQLLQLNQTKLEAEKQAKELVLLTREKQLQESELANEALEKARAEQALAATTAQLRALKREQQANRLLRETQQQELIIKQKELEEREKQIQLSMLTEENVTLAEEKKEKEEEIAEQGAVLEKELLRTQQSYIIIVLVSLLLLLAIAGFIWSLRQRRRISSQNAALEAQKEVLETQQGIIMEKNEELQASEEEIRQNSEELLAINEQMQGALTELHKQKALVDKKNANITSSINYAQRIQEAILPSDTLINAALPDSFVFYVPKDIVSGDFYWFFDNDTHTYIAAVDCTGHGVPGAFMSLIGHSLLRDVVTEKGLVNPSKILDAMHVGIMKGLKQDKEESNNKDGMDASLCIIDKQDKKLLFAGAHNPLVYIQKGELHEIKGDRYSIGGRKKLYAEHFTEHEVSLDSETNFYLFSDGFQDQFGGPKGRKFMRRQLKEKLLAIHHLPMKDQGKLMEQEFYQWMGFEKQLDDVLLMGFKCG